MVYHLDYKDDHASATRRKYELTEGTIVLILLFITQKGHQRSLIKVIKKCKSHSRFHFLKLKKGARHGKKS